MGDNVLRLIIIDNHSVTPHDFLSALQIPEMVREANASPHPFFHIDTVRKAHEGLDKISTAITTGFPYAIVFIDMKNSKKNNPLSMIKMIWQLDPDIQIVIGSAKVAALWRDINALVGVNDNILVIKKPFVSIAVRQLASVLSSKWILARNAKIQDTIKQEHTEKQTKTLKQSLCFLRSAIESSRSGVLVMDNFNAIVDFNQPLIQILGLSRDLLSDKNTEKLLNFLQDHLKNPYTFINRYKALRSQPEATSSDILKFKSGKVVECSSTPHQLKNKTIGRIWCFHDITEQFYLQEKLVKQALHDPLTELPNRILLSDRIQQAMAKAHREKDYFAIIFLDLDRFKLVNDSLSHTAGDDLLREVASRLSNLLREEDTLARIGGDEFVMVIPHLHKEKSAITVAQKIISCFDTPFTIQGHALEVTTSVGISLYPEDGDTAHSLLANADLAMYASKEAGGNQFRFYTEHLNAQTQQRAIQDEELRSALAKREFFIVYQPLIEISTNRVTSLEALLRWQHPTKGVILPLSFVPTAEETGLIVPIGEWILEAVCKQINDWHKKGLPFIRVAINVSIHQLKQENFAETIDHILKKHNVLPNYLEIEITENIIVNNSYLHNMIKKIKELGVNIVIDDFGSGNPSFNYLTHMQFDRLKIDQMFVHNIENSCGDKAIVESMINMARSLDYQVLASGVETKQQINFLCKKQCNEVQGNYLSKPLTPSEILLFFKPQDKVN